ncbi:MAG: hypothetical protein IKE55_01545 [Kiritimatiellae bacterium]|nr:hypothetical protein [Kiritimatiellia bacterium]
MRAWLAAAVAAAAVAASAMPEIPKESASALGVTRGRPFTSGVVFVDGKYVEPPYVVERWGNGIRINKKSVTGQVIPWNEFLKTQEGVKVTKTETPAPAQAEPTPAATSFYDDFDGGSLDDLFDDDPKPKKKRSSQYGSYRPSAAAKPKVSVSYSIEGEFVTNAATKAMVARINSVRTEIDRILRNGGFICFGESYSRVAGDARSTLRLLEKLPDLQRRSADLAAFRAGVRAAGLVYLNEVLCEELYRNKVDYLKLQERFSKLKRDEEWKAMINEVSQPLL